MTVGKATYDLPTFSFAIATMNPIELGQGTFPLSEAATDRFAIMVNIAYLKPEEEEKLVNFDFKKVRLKGLMSKERIIELRAVITREVFLHEALAKYIRRLVGATRPYNAETDWHHRSPSELVETCVDLGASPRATICWGRLVKVWALLHAARRGLSRRRAGAGQVRARPSGVARPARRQSRRHRRDGHRRHRRQGTGAMTAARRIRWSTSRRSPRSSSSSSNG